MNLLIRYTRKHKCKAKWARISAAPGPLFAQDNTDSRLLAIKRCFLITRQETPKAGYRLGNGLFQADLATSPLLGSLEKVRLPRGQTGQRTSKSGNLPELLSDRELEILQLMAAGLSNQDIADRLIITLGTVKSHANHTFGKLGVQGRVKAINQARDLHLISALICS